MILPNGDVFIFDNGNNKTKTGENAVPANESYSRGVIYRVDKTNMTIEQIWQYGKELGSKFYSPYISDVDYIDNNHYIVHSGGHSELDGNTLNTPAGLGKVDKLTSTTVEIKNNKEIFNPISFEVNDGDRIAIIGKNGIGKSSILKLLLREELQYNGNFKIINDLKISYVSQSTDNLKGKLKLFAKENNVDESIFKAMLIKMGLSQNDFDTNIQDMSEGQKKKVLVENY